MTQVFCRKESDVVVFIVEIWTIFITKEKSTVFLGIQVSQLPTPFKDKPSILIEIRQFFQKVFCGQSIVIIAIAFKDNDAILLSYARNIITATIMCRI